MNQPRSEWVWILLLGLNAAVLYWWFTREQSEPAALTAEPPALLEAQTESEAPAVVTPQPPAERCWAPESSQQRGSQAEAPTAADWQMAAGSGARLAEDPCGNLWALWFNDWRVFADGDPLRVGHLRLPRDAAFGKLAASGVAAFLPLRSGLWVLGRNGQSARLNESGWALLEDLGQRCDWAQMAVLDDQPWLNCSGGQSSRTLRWENERWRPVGDALRAPRYLVLSQDRRLLSLARGEIAEFQPADERWQSLAAELPGPSRDFRAAADAKGISVAQGKRILDFDRNGRIVRQLDVAADVSGLWRHPEHGLYASIRGLGLNIHDGQRWYRWRYAQRLPGSDARDLWIDRRNRLWLAGRPLLSIDATEAAAAITRLSDPAPLAGQRYADACAAAADRLGRRAIAGQIAQERVDGQNLVFFDGTQVCPNPWLSAAMPLHVRRRADGALLRTPVNASQRRTRCSLACGANEQAELQRQWRLSQLIPTGVSTRAPLQEKALAPPEPPPRSSPGPAMLLGTDGDSWVGAGEHGVYQHDGEGWIHHPMADGRIMAIAEDPHGGIWVALSGVATGQSPLHYWRGRSWRSVELPRTRVLSSLAAVPGGVIAGGFGGVWQVGSAAQVLDEFDRRPPRSGSRHISVDAARMLWLSRNSGEHGLILNDNGRWGRVSSREGLHSDRVRLTAHDDDGGVWILFEDGQVAIHSRFELMAKMHWHRATTGADW